MPLLGGQKQGINIHDFDPIYRRRDFPQVKRNVVQMFDLKKIYNPTTYKLMKAQAKKKIQDFVHADQDQLDFRNEDPRKKNVDDYQKQKEFLQDRLH